MENPDIQGELIAAHEAARTSLEDAERKLCNFFKDKIQGSLDAARTSQEFEKVKEQLVPMPQCAGKVLIFRAILILEQKYKNAETN